jgi:hypothetical protein
MLCHVTVSDRLVDPRRAGHFGCLRAAGEAPRVRGAGGVQHGLAFVLDRGRGADMHRALLVAVAPLITVAVQLRLSTQTASKASLPTVEYRSDAVVDGTTRALDAPTTPGDR